MKFQNPSMHGSLTDGCTHGQTHNPKPMCPVNFFEAAGIIRKVANLGKILRLFRQINTAQLNIKKTNTF